MQPVEAHVDERVYLRQPSVPVGPAVNGANGRALWLLSLDDVRATDPARAGGTAAALARATAAGFPKLSGFVLTPTATTVARFPADLPTSLEAELRAAWCALTDGGSRSVVVRASSVVEDATSLPMAGLFESHLDVRGWDSFLDAVALVLASARSVPGVETAPVAVVVQPLLVSSLGAVLSEDVPDAAGGVERAAERLDDHVGLVASLGRVDDLL